MNSYPSTILEETSTMKLKLQGGPMTPDVPQEIVDLIIDNLQDDPLALRACALTAHNWVHRSRRHLHFRVRVGEYYINLKRYSCLNTAQYVRELDLYMVRTDRGRQRTTTERLWQMVQRFPNLRSLVIRDFEFYRLSAQRYDVLRNIASRLRSLEIHHVQFADSGDFLSFISSCTQLRTLVLEDGQFYDAAGRIRADEQCLELLDELKKAVKPLPGSGLRSLTLGTLTSSVEFDKTVNAWISVLTREGLLKELVLSKDVPESCAGPLAAVGSSAIDLRVARCHTRLEKPAQTGIENCTNIRALSFVTSLVVPPRNSEQSWIVPFLQQLPSPSGSPTRTPPPLRTLTFELHWSDKDCIDVDFLTEVDHILSSRQDTFGGLEEVTFAVHRHLSPKLQQLGPAPMMKMDMGPFAEVRSLPERTLQFKIFLRACLGTHLKGVVARTGCLVKLVFPNDGDVFRVEARAQGEECKH